MKNLLITIAWLLTAGVAAAQNITGPSTAEVGQSSNYTFSNGTLYMSITWVTANGTVVSSSNAGTTYYATILWTSPGTASLTVLDQTYQGRGNKSVTVSVAQPNTTFTHTPLCGSTDVTRTTAPPAGVNWYWQTSGTGTDMSLGFAQTLNRTTGGVLYLRARWGTSGAWSASTQSAGTVVVNAAPGVPAAAAASRCGSGTTAFAVSAPANANTVKWYDAATGGNLLGTGLSFTTPSITATTIYYMAGHNTTTGCESATRATATATILAMPANPTPGTSPTVCAGATATLTGTVGAGGDQLRWYNTGGTLLATGNSYTTPALAATTPYYLASYNTTTTCETPAGSRVAITATVNAPAQPTSSDVARCGAGTVTLTATSGAGGNTVRWYSALTGGTLLANGSPYTTPGISVNTVYYAVSYNTTTGCESAPRKVVNALVNAVPGLPAGGSASRCGTGSVTLTPTAAPNGNTLKWYTAATGGTLLTTAPSYSPSVSATATYYAAGYHATTGCEATTRLAVTATVNAIPAAPTATGMERMGPGTFKLTGNGTPAGGTYRWYSGTGNTLLATAASYTTPTLAATTSNYVNVRALSAQGCESAQTNLTVTVRADQNYVTTHIVQVDNILTEQAASDLPIGSKLESYQIMDGLGRPLQNVITQGSPSRKDIVQPHVYDSYDRENRTYLPFASTESSGLYKDQAAMFAGDGDYVNDFYRQVNGPVANDTRPFGKSEYDDSPLNRTLKSFGPGQAWHTNNKFAEQKDLVLVEGTAASQDKIFIWSINGSGLPVRNTAINSGYYPNGALAIKHSVNEDGGIVRTYTNKEGKLICKMVHTLGSTTDLSSVASAANWVRTYHVYDDFGRLRMVLQPELVRLVVSNPAYAITATDLFNFAFQYKYDERHRIVEKQVPGAQPVYIVYDKRDRMVLVQDGNQRNASPKEWTFTKYDELNRPVLTGKFTDNNDRATVQNAVNTFYSTLVTGTAWYETYIGSGSGNVLGYDNKSYPQLSTVNNYHTATYYDNYDAFNAPAAYAYLNESLPGQESSASLAVGSLPTAAQTRNLSTNAWMRTVSYYNKKYQVIQTVGDHQKGTARVSMVVDFAGKLLRTKRTYIVNSATTAVNETFAYDHANRLESVKHAINGGSEVMLVKNKYNEVGQLVDKQLHSTDNGTTFKQSVDYRYNIRGWLTKINEADVSAIAAGDAGVDHFGMELHYTTAIAGVSPTASFAGNIAAVQWSKGNGGSVKRQAYAYGYDARSQLTSASHFDFVNSAWVSNNNAYQEALTYDHNGNIKTLTRKGFNGANMDVLTYFYTGNQLNYVNDTGDALAGFINGNTGTDDYSYDFNGNLDKDKNKGFSTKGNIRYNYLNLPEEIVKGSEKVRYIYDATGRKLAQDVYNTGGTVTKNTDYIGELVFEGNVLKLISHGEGRVVPDGAGWEYQYFLKDHLGNVRVTFTAKPQTAATSTANFEAATNPAFLNYTAISTFDLVDHTDEAGTAYQKVQWMNGGVNGRVGLAKSLAVMPGDEVTAAAYGKYMNLGSTGNNTPLLAQLAAAFGVSAGSTGEQLKLYSSLSSYAGTIPGGDRAGDNEAAPKAFVTILFFNKNFDLVDAAWDQMTTTGAQTSGTVKQPPHDLLSVTAKAPEAGYAYIYISNEHPYFVDVYFDDVSVVHTPSPIVAVSDYFPYGLQYNAGEKTGGLEQKILYNSKELQDELSLNWYDYGARMYMADIGRWGVVDPLGEKFVRWSAYNYALNNPLRFVDPTGMEAEAYQGADAQAFWKGHQDDRQTRRDAKDNIKSFVKSGEITRAEGREVWRKYNTLRKQHGQTENEKEENEPDAQQGGLGEEASGVPLSQWVDPASLKLKKIAEAWYGSAHINEEIWAYKIPGGYVRVHLNTTVNFNFSGSVMKKDLAQYFVATAMDRARAAVWEELYANPGMLSSTAARDFKEYFAINLMRLTHGSEVKSYNFPGVSTFEVEFQWYPSLPPRTGQHGW